MLIISITGFEKWWIDNPVGDINIVNLVNSRGVIESMRMKIENIFFSPDDLKVFFENPVHKTFIDYTGPEENPTSYMMWGAQLFKDVRIPKGTVVMTPSWEFCSTSLNDLFDTVAEIANNPQKKTVQSFKAEIPLTDSY